MSIKVQYFFTIIVVFLLVSESIQQPINNESPESPEIPNNVGDGRSPRQKRTTCLSWNGGEHCEKECQALEDPNTGKCHCTGSCEWSSKILTCECQDPSCDC